MNHLSDRSASFPVSVALHVRPRASRPGSSRVEPAERAVHLAYRELAQSPKLYNTMGALMAVYGVCKSWTWGCDFDILIWWLWGEDCFLLALLGGWGT